MRAVCCCDPLQTIPVRLLNVQRKGQRSRGTGGRCSGSSGAEAREGIHARRAHERALHHGVVAHDRLRRRWSPRPTSSRHHLQLRTREPDETDSPSRIRAAARAAAMPQSAYIAADTRARAS